MNLYEKTLQFLSIIINRLRIASLRFRGAKIGQSVKAYGRFSVYHPSNLEMGNRCTINENVLIYCREKVKVGDRVRISAGVQIHTGKLLIEKRERTHVAKPIIIEDNVWIAAGTIISAGVRIGKNSVVGANSVVIRDIEPDTMYAGNPARKIRNIGFADKPCVC